jgi:predicted transposase/invertase (TIGR01784 family)
MAKYLDPKADVVFKKIFGDHPNLLISFLNAVLPLASDKPIVELSYLSNEQIPPIPTFKRTIADVKCKDATGRCFIVEMQMNWTDSFRQRLLFGTSQAIVKQLERGEDYRFLEPVYGLGFVAEIYEKTSSDWYHHYQLVKKGDLNSDAIEHLQLIFIELPKFPAHSPDEKKLRLLWLRFLREIDEKTKIVSEELLEVPEIAEAVKLAEESAYTPSELAYYESYWDQVRRDKTIVIDSIEAGRIKGLAEGEARGRIKGKTEGKIEEKRRMVKKLLRRGLSIDIIVEDTELTREEVETIKADLEISVTE